jgi:serine/threonine-protein kinase
MSERPKSASRSAIGQILGGTYSVERLLGVGSVGALYAARHVRTGGLYAVKILHRKLLPGPDTAPQALARFQEEARILYALRHPHILPVIDIDKDETGAPFLVMELLEGENLSQRLRQRGALPLAQALRIAHQVGSALQAAHRSGVVHRNLKPENVFLTRHDLGDRTLETVMVTDFGLLRLRRPAAGLAGAEPSLLGISQFTAPEALALQGEGPAIDGRADQWAMGVMLYRMLGGRMPFEGENLREVLQRRLTQPPLPLAQLAPELPQRVTEAVARAMAPRREDRFPSVAELLRALGEPEKRIDRQTASGPDLEITRDSLRPVPLPLSSAPTPISKPGGAQAAARRGKGIALLAGAALLLLISGGATVGLLRQREREDGGLALRGAPQAPSAPGEADEVQGRPGGPRGEVALRVTQAAPAAAPVTASTPVTAPAPAPSTMPAPAARPAVVAAPAAAAPPAPAPTPEEVRLPAPAAIREMARDEVRDDQTPDPARSADGGEGDPPEVVLQAAQSAFAEGNHVKAVSLATGLTARGGAYAAAAWRFLGTAACRTRDLRLAGKAYRHLSAGDRQLMLGVCERQGLSYLNGEFQFGAWPLPP